MTLVYVGKTDHLNRRLAQHRRSPPKRMQKDLKALNNSFNDVIAFAIAHRVGTLTAASYFEQREILHTNSRSLASGYNTLRGGSVQTDSQYRYLKFHQII